MTSSELARDKLKYWGWIDRAKKVKKSIPDHWLKYGYPPTDATVIMVVCLDSIVDKIQDAFERDSWFYKQISKR